MNTSSIRTSFVRRIAVLAASTVAVVTIASACTMGGKEGDRCNPLVLQDECNAGLHCKPATCSEAYCCPTDRTSTDPHCNAEGCPDTDAGADDAATDAIADAVQDAALDGGG